MSMIVPGAGFILFGSGDISGGGDIWVLSTSSGQLYEGELPFSETRTWAYGQFFGFMLEDLEPPYPTSMTLVGSSDVIGVLRFYYGDAGLYPGTDIEVEWGQTVALGSFGTSGEISFESFGGSEVTGTVTLTDIIFHYS